MTTLQAGLIWSTGGFVVGFLVCYMLVHAAVLPGGAGRKLSVSRPLTHLARPLPEKLRTALGVLILLMGVLASFQYYSVTSCQAKYNTAVAEALSQRSEAQRVTSSAQIKLLTTRSSGDPTAGQRAVDDYIQALRDLEEVRRATPYPAPASCGAF